METTIIYLSIFIIILLIAVLFIMYRFHIKTREQLNGFSSDIDEIQKQTAETRDELQKMLAETSEDQKQSFAEVMTELSSCKETVREEREADFGDDDDMYENAKEIVMKEGKASTSYIQRKLGVGYSRAAHLMDMLEENGVIGPAQGGKPREVIVAVK